MTHVLLRKNKRIICVVLYFLLIMQCTFSYASASVEASAQLFSYWFQSKNDATTVVKQGEIWSRVRSRLHIRAPSTAPLYQRHIREYVRSPVYINKLVNNSSPYLYYILGEVEKRGMPSEIALLPMIESDFNPFTQSHKGALGLWQIMPALGRLYGLKQNAHYDGRRDIYESTKVALDHLEYLHKKFGGNWLLALAAYNSGESRVLNAIKKNKAAKKPTDFWSLPLPQETKHYVPKLLALASIVKSPKQYGVVLPAIPNQPVFTRIDAKQPMNIANAAKMVDLSETQMRKLNPGFKKTANPSGPFKLVVPIQRVDSLKTVTTSTTSTTSTTTTTVSSPKQQKHTAKIHIVKKGESLPKIARKHGLKISTLLAYNHLPHASSIIHPGQKLVVG